MKSNCCNAITMLGYKNISNDDDIVLAVPATICTKCRKPCKLVNMKKLRKEKLDKINDEL